MRQVLDILEHTVYVYDFAVIDARMYMMKTSDEILVIDPCIDEQLLVDAKGVKRAVIFLTHEHYDHISGVNWLREQMDCTVYASENCADAIASAKLNGSARFPFLFLNDRKKYDYVRKNYKLPYTCSADITFAKEMNRIWHGHLLNMRIAPGHSCGGSFLLLDGRLLFAGDSILGNGMELRSVGASRKDFETYVMRYIETLDINTVVFPGHGEVNSLGAFLEKIDTEG